MAPEFDSFLENLFSRLSDDNFYQSESLTRYLSLPSSDRSNDEANIVDAKITSVLIEG